MDYHMMVNVSPFLPGLGIVVGFLAGFLGMGGGIILVPTILYGLGLLGYTGDSMHIAIGTSLAIIIPTGMSSAYAHWRRGAVRFDLLAKIGLGSVAGVVVGTLAASFVGGYVLRVFFAVALMLVAVVTSIDARRFNLVQDIPRQPWAAISGGVIGMLSSLMGIGGATISVPYMLLCRVPIKEAVGTAAALGIMITVPAVVGFSLIGHGHGNLPPFSIGYVNFLAVALITPTSILVAPHGARLAHKISVNVLRRLFSVLLLIVAFRMLYGVFAA